MRKVLKGLAFSVPAGVLLAAALSALPASAQTVFDPTFTPEVNTGGWINNIGQAVLIFGAIAVVLIVFGYLRFSPKFRASSDDTPTVLAPRVAVGAVAARPAGPPPSMAAAVAAPAAPAPAAAPSPAASAPAPAPAAAPEAAAPTPSAPAAAPAPASDKPAHVEPDQETFDRVLQEQIDKGVDRRVAEGRAKSAAIVAARKKAGG